MSTGGGAISLAAGSLIDVSAYQGSGSQGDAGSISLYAPIGGVALNGSIKGQANGGQGGSFSIVTNTLDTVNGTNLFSALNNQLAFNPNTGTGGFIGTLSFEASYGNIAIPAGQSVTAQSVTITADGTNPDGSSNGGSIVLDGTINVSQLGQGGTVALYAQKDLTIDPSGYINASAQDALTNPNAKGGAVTLSVNTGMLTFAGGTIDVSGYGQAKGGTVTFVDPPPASGGNTSNMSLGGTIRGASSVVAQIDKVYLNQFLDQNGNTVINSASQLSQIQSDITALMNADANLVTELPQGLSLTDENGNILSAAGIFHLQPGVVIESTGNITLGTPWTLTSWRFGSGNEPGTLTLRAGGSLDIEANITDSPSTSYMTLLSSNSQPSWSYNFAAGANMGSADPLAAVPARVQGATGGNLVIGTSSTSGNLVYTQTGTIQFASGGNTTIYPYTYKATGALPAYMIAQNMPYSLATYAGPIQGNVDGSLVIYPDAAIQSATGSIDIQVGGNLDLTGNNPNGAQIGVDLGAIRTTGEHGASFGYYAYYSYEGGGSITLDVAGDVIGGLNANAWLYSGLLQQETTAQGVIYYPVIADYGETKRGTTAVFTEGIAAMAGGNVSVSAGGDFYSQVGTFGRGNLQVFTGGDVSGRFLVKDGTGVVSAVGNFGTPAQPQLIEMGASKVSVSAQGAMEIGAIVNPDLAENLQASWDNGYTPNSSITLTAVTGNVNIDGHLAPGYSPILNPYLPPSVEISAPQGDIVVSGYFTQLPAQFGNLIMNAGRDIVFDNGAVWRMSDADPTTVYPGGVAASSPDLTSHASTPVHTGDASPVSITAGGDIIDMTIYLPKAATISAGGTISDLSYYGQNVYASGPAGTTSIIAGQAIEYGQGTNVQLYQIQLGGPGYLVVEAGGGIDLGTSKGIQTIGNSANSAILSAGETGASLIVAAGVATLDPQTAGQTLSTFFSSVQAAGVEYTDLKNSGDAAGAAAAISQVRASTIDPFLAQANSGQDITMTSSQISTAGGGSIFVLATGALNVGTTLLASASQGSTGILTETGGAVNIFTVGDLNVNQSRLMTFQGGDITVWSDQGSINAGKGSKTAINASPPQYSCSNGVCTETFTPPAVGSGIRALTYATNPNTPAPPEGNIYLFAPSGDIDAGEAGISGGTVVLGATAILNASNISFSTGSVGLPAASQGVSLGALTGTSDMSKSTISSDTGALATSQERVTSAQPIEDMVVKWIDVKVMSYDLTFGGDDTSEENDDSRKKK
jgi:hypothetical protein